MNNFKRRRYFGEMLNDKIRSGNYVLQAELKGNIQYMSLGTLISINCNENRTVRLEINNDDVIGEIFIEEGNIVHAKMGIENGEDAFHQIMTWREGAFSIFPNEIPPQKTISKNWSTLLLESTKKLDETVEKIENEPSSEVAPEPKETIDWSNFQIDIEDNSVAGDALSRQFDRMARAIKRIEGIKEIIIMSHDGNIIYNDPTMDTTKYVVLANTYINAGEKISAVINAKFQKHVIVQAAENFFIVNRGQDIITITTDKNAQIEMLLEELYTVLKRYR